MTFYECLTGRPPVHRAVRPDAGRPAPARPVPMAPVPEPLRPLVARGMAKDPQYRPADAAALATELRAVAAGAYGADWEDRGRSQLGEAALLLAALWPTAGVPALQGATIEQVRLSQGAPSATGSRAAHGARKARRPRTHRTHRTQPTPSRDPRASLPLEPSCTAGTSGTSATKSTSPTCAIVSEHDGSRASAARRPRQASRRTSPARHGPRPWLTAAVAAAAGTVAATSGRRSAGARAHPARSRLRRIGRHPSGHGAPPGFTVVGDVYVQLPATAPTRTPRSRAACRDATAGEVARLFPSRSRSPRAGAGRRRHPEPGGRLRATRSRVSPIVATYYQVRLFTRPPPPPPRRWPTRPSPRSTSSRPSNSERHPLQRPPVLPREGTCRPSTSRPPRCRPASQRPWYVYLGVNRAAFGNDPAAADPTC